MNVLNKTILELIKTYPKDGTHPYDWPRDGSFSGVTQDLIYQGVTIAKAREDKATYCCGYKFELWFLAAIKNKMTLGSIQNVKDIKNSFFIIDPNKRSGSQEVLISKGLGYRVDLKDALPGDVMQIWRASGSGHSAIYLKHDQHKLYYHSTQKATNGIGDRNELFGGNNPLTEIYITRPLIVNI